MKVWYITKKQVKISFVTAILLVAVSVVYGVGVLFVSAKERMLPVYSVETPKKQVALTFDVAWEDSDLNQILTILQENKAKATFFVTGDWARRYPDGVKKILAAGNEVQNHSDRHPHVASIDGGSLMLDTRACEQTLTPLIGKKPTLYRAPYGEYDNEMLAALTQEGYTVVQWDVDSRDWQPSATVDTIVGNVVGKTGPGSILLFHVDAKPKCTPQALQKILPELTKQGYAIGTASDLLIKENYVIDRNGRMKHK